MLALLFVIDPLIEYQKDSDTLTMIQFGESWYSYDLYSSLIGMFLVMIWIRQVDTNTEKYMDQSFVMYMLYMAKCAVILIAIIFCIFKGKTLLNNLDENWQTKTIAVIKYVCLGLVGGIILSGLIALIITLLLRAIGYMNIKFINSFMSFMANYSIIITWVVIGFMLGVVLYYTLKHTGVWGSDSTTKHVNNTNASATPMLKKPSLLDVKCKEIQDFMLQVTINQTLPTREQQAILDLFTKNIEDETFSKELYRALKTYSKKATPLLGCFDKTLQVLVVDRLQLKLEAKNTLLEAKNTLLEACITQFTVIIKDETHCIELYEFMQIPEVTNFGLFYESLKTVKEQHQTKQ
jgi:hypothetical protein